MEKRNIITLVLAVFVLSALFTSCKTSEKNYKEAYDIAVSKQRGGVDNKYSAFIEREKRLREVTVVGGDSVRVVSQYVKPMDGETAKIYKYGVAIGEYKQMFNATSYRDRIHVATGDNTAYIVVGQEKNYIVVYKGFDTKEEAAAYIKDKSNFKIAIPKTGVWILECIDK